MKRSRAVKLMRFFILLCVLIATVIVGLVCSQTQLYENRGAICGTWCQLGEPPSDAAWEKCLEDCNRVFIDAYVDAQGPGDEACPTPPTSVTLESAKTRLSPLAAGELIFSGVLFIIGVACASVGLKRKIDDEA